MEEEQTTQWPKEKAQKDQELLTLPEHLSSSPVLVGFVLLDL
jgi:hypothetical protein